MEFRGSAKNLKRDRFIFLNQITLKIDRVTPALGFVTRSTKGIKIACVKAKNFTTACS